MCVTAALNTSSRQYYIHAYLCSNNQWRPSFEALMPNEKNLVRKILVEQTILFASLDHRYKWVAEGKFLLMLYS